MPTITGDEWKYKSEKGELCGMAGCMQPPTSQVPKCRKNYCYDHLGSHLHIVMDEEQSDQDSRDEGLR